MRHAGVGNEGRIKTNTFGASALVRRFASTIADATNGAPILDVACGSGRNAMVFAELGCIVICVDIDLTRLKNQLTAQGSGFGPSSRLQLHTLDLINDPWPFKAGAIGAIINIHFLLPTLFPCFAYSLNHGGYLLIETISGRGGNYLELPAAGEVKSAFEAGFHLELYEERKVGPEESDAVTVKLLGRRASV
jgi:SAM-dependent methyltransferase